MKDYSHFGPAYRGFKVEDNVYVPAPTEDFSGEDPFVKMAKVRGHVRDLVFDDSYPYLDKSFKFRLNRWFLYNVMGSITRVISRVFYGVRVEGAENLKKHKDLFANGAMTVCNHIGRWDMICVLEALKYRRMWIPMFRLSFMGKDGWMMKHVGGIPVPDTRQGLRLFNEAFDELHERKAWIHIFPESCSWKYYAPLRPFKIGAFNMAYKYNLPIIPFVITYRERTGFYKIFKTNEPLFTIHVGEPILPDTTHPRKEDAMRLREQTHAQMLRMAGIIHNPWPAAMD